MMGAESTPNMYSNLAVNNKYDFVETFSLPTDAHNVKKHRVTKTF